MLLPKQYMGWKVDFTTPKGEPALLSPDSVTWRVMKNPVTTFIGGVAAFLMEFADPRIRSGVSDHSTYLKDPIGRATRTGLAAALGTYGPASAARQVIAGITKMHEKVQGTTPGGLEYSAMDTQLLDWVAATANFGFVTAYHRYAKKLSPKEIHRYYQEGHVVAKLYGVERTLNDEYDFYDMMHKLSPIFEPHEINTVFLETAENSVSSRNIPPFLSHYLVCAAVDMIPAEIQNKLQLGEQYKLSSLGCLCVKSVAQSAEWFANERSMAASACERLGLPRKFLWLSQAKQKQLLADLGRAEMGFAQK
ncbi:oxygenase MpaB family protein [Halioxenophilus sp. WMMB6]|uniref:oxygenase MpaB family protein n=1 Tax=Halioxenophilus sp. WMMB6 TaxID=3073815 RepID=UPI00295F27E6|nr:oxygenase MpaB family protein [Halioxenophilus sp. WMMB6]